MTRRFDGGNGIVALAWVITKLLPAIVSVAVLVCDVELDAAVNVTLPEPLPVAPLEIVTHDAPLVAVQVQPAVVVTVTVPLPPPGANDWLVGEIANAQGTAACVMVNVDPAIVSVPTRLVVPVWAATLTATVPDPVPAAPAVTVIHAALLTAVHTHPAPALTVVLPVPPAAGIDRLAGEIVGAQGGLNANVFDRAVDELPPGPTAWSTVSYTTPGVSGEDSNDTKSTRIIPSLSGAGFPRFTVRTGTASPAGKICRE